MHLRVPTNLYDGEVVDVYFGNPDQCTAGPDGRCLSTQSNALSRVRSSGMVRSRNGAQTPYFTANAQYLYGRNRTVAQNETRHLQLGDPSLTPGAGGSFENVYASNTATQCPGARIGTVFDASTYYPVYHHPGNPAYDTQGAVSGAERMWRLRYDASVNTGPPLTTPYGVLQPNALAFVNGARIFDLKDRIGAPYPCHPLVAPQAGTPLQCVPLYANVAFRP